MVHIVLAERDEPLVVECEFALAADDGRGSLEEFERDVTGNPLLGDVDEGIVGFALGGPPPTLVNQIGIARSDRILGGEGSAVEDELFELAMRGIQKRSAGSFVNTSRFHTDQSILDQIDSADAVAPTDCIEGSDQVDSIQLGAIH